MGSCDHDIITCYIFIIMTMSNLTFLKGKLLSNLLKIKPRNLWYCIYMMLTYFYFIKCKKYKLLSDNTIYILDKLVIIQINYALLLLYKLLKAFFNFLFLSL